MSLLLVIANLIALIGSILMLISGYQTDKKKVISIAAGQMFCNIISNALVKGWPGVINNSVALTRNLLCYFGKFTKTIKYTLMILAVVLIAIFNNVGIIGHLPILSSILYTSVLDTKDPLKLKMVIGMTVCCWLFYDLYVGLYVAAFFDSINIIAHIIAIVHIKKLRNNLSFYFFYSLINSPAT